MPQNPQTGACIHLTSDMKCSIYDTRPDICRIDKMYEINSGSIGGVDMSRKEYYKLNTLACHRMIDEEGMDKKWKIKLTDYDTEGVSEVFTKK
jgi:Fe-S-cluster containining protein